MTRIQLVLRTVVLGFVIAMTSAAIAQGQPIEYYADTQGALGVAKGPAAAAIRTALTAKSYDCTGMDFQPRRCALADSAFNADVHYARAEGSERQLAFVSVRWQSDPTGNAVEAKGLVFVAEKDGPFRLLGQTDLIGDSVDEVAFETHRITYTTNYLRPGDSRSFATGRRRYELPLRPDGVGPVAIQRTGFGAVAAGPVDEVLQLAKRLYEAGESSPLEFDKVERAGDWLSGDLVDLTRRAATLSRRCSIYDGDARLGGAQGTGGPIRMRYEPIKSDDPANRRVILVTAGQAEAPQAVSRTRVVLLRTSAGWRIHDLLAAGQQGYRATLAARTAQCR